MRHISTVAISFFAAVCFLFSSAVFAQSEKFDGIAVVVNDDAITMSDLVDRMRLAMVSSGLPNTDKVKKSLQPRVLSVLIEERLMMQEAARLDITVSPEQVDDGFAYLAKENNLESEEFAGLITKQGVNMQTLRDQIASQIAWNTVIQKELRPKIDIGDNEVDVMIERMETSVGKTKYLLSEIYLPVATPADEPEVKALAENLISQIRSGKAPFQRVAQQFSQAAGATQGGDLGWIQEGQLPDDLDTALANMNEGQLSSPIRSLTGFHILYLRKKDKLTLDATPSRDDLYNKMGLERLEKLQRRHLMDLKAAAFIEQRV